MEHKTSFTIHDLPNPERPRERPENFGPEALSAQELLAFTSIRTLNSNLVHPREVFKKAVHVNIAIMRAFVKLREILFLNKELAHQLAQLERKIEKHDEEIKFIFDAIRQLMTPPEPKHKRIGFL